MNRIPIKFQIEPEAEEAIRLCLLFKRSVAVEKDSDDPYLDFRHSMLQMILEKQIYSKDDLRQLLDCFLQLNSWGYYQSFHRDLEWSLLDEIQSLYRFRETSTLLLWLLVT
uniref:Transcription repressor n=1 Tax=Salix viminalis TaxID=40686 RepID=A0A6N2LZV1_SALVM